MLFQNTTAYTKEEIITFQKYHFRKVNQVTYRINLVLSVLLLFVSVFLLYLHDSMGFLFLFIGIGFFVLFEALPYLQYAHMNKKSKLLSKIENTYQFYEDEIEITNSISNSKIKYDQLYRVYESNTCFYLYIGGNQGFILNKQSFQQGTPEEFAMFLKTKMEKNYIIR